MIYMDPEPKIGPELKQRKNEGQKVRTSGGPGKQSVNFL